ncbi:MAG: DUF3341 domain-containing protein [Oligoflexia bacterium]|nr:DUF3341 domain-containing protein [Oligoflexia bacterium]
MSAKTLTAVFGHLDCMVDAVDAVKRAGLVDFAATSPLPREDIEDVIYEGHPSPVRWFTMTGAIFGGTAGFSLCAFTHLNWPMIIPAGKPLVSIPPFLVITFEATILFGCLFTLLGLVAMCRLPGFGLQPELTDRRFSNDKFGLVVNGLSDAQVDTWKTTLATLGAQELVVTEADHA